MKNRFSFPQISARIATKFHLLLVALLLSQFSMKAQCPTIMGNHSSFVFLHDTTTAIYFVDTTLYTAHTSYVWTFSDGVTHTGPSSTHIFTANFRVTAGFTYTVTVIDTAAGCSGTDASDSRYWDNFYPPVFNCSYLYKPRVNYATIWDCDFSANLINVTYDEADASGLAGPVVRWRSAFVWGNGDTTNFDNYVGVYPTYDHDFTNPPYTYGGTYITKLVSIAINPTDSATCPSVDTVMPWRVSGPMSHPLLRGRTTLCIGDTLRLIAQDTTALFGNMLHAMDTAITGATFNGSAASYMLPVWQRDTATVSDTSYVINGVTLADSGYYYFSRNSCDAPFDSIYVTVLATCPTGATSLNAISNEKIQVAPNPSNGNFTITLPQHTNDVAITIYDLAGKAVYQKPLNNSDLKVMVTTENMSAGVYFLKVEVNGSIYHKRIVVM